MSLAATRAARPRSGGARSARWSSEASDALIVTGLASTLFPALRKTDELTSESLMQAKLQQSAAEPPD